MDSSSELVDRARDVIADVTDGKSLSAACRDRGLALTSFHRAISSVRELGQDYARAREIRADVLVDEAIAAADNPDLDPQRARNMMTIRQWTASKHNSRVYGERLDLNVAQTISIGEALTEARARMLRPICDPAPILDAEVIEMPAITGPEPSDNESVSGSSAAEPDIFS